MKKYLVIMPFVAMLLLTGCGKDSMSASGSLNGHDYVDLGLPSGTMWATCNIGAKKPSDYGNYYAWGEVVTKAIYSESTYTYSGTSERLPASADAAAVNWGDGWRMPSYNQFQELLTHCSNKITKKGITFTGTNGNSIFLPAAGRRNDDELYDAGSYGHYWSSSLHTGNPYYAWSFGFSGIGYSNRENGYTVRPVCPAQN